MSDHGKGLILSHSFNLPGKLHRSGQSRSGDNSRILPLPEPGLNIGLMKQAWVPFFAYRSRECIKETAFLLITDQSHQHIRDSLMRRAVRGKD